MNAKPRGHSVPPTIRRRVVSRVGVLALALSGSSCLSNETPPPDTLVDVRYAASDDLPSRFASGDAFRAGGAVPSNGSRAAPGATLAPAGTPAAAPYTVAELDALKEQILAASVEGRKETQLVTLGLAALAAGDVPSALAATREAWLSLQETRSRTLGEDLAASPLRDYALAYARVLLATSERREGVVLLERLVAASPAWLPAYRALFDHYSRVGAAGLSERVARRALSHAGEAGAWPRVALARSLRAQGRTEQALAALKAAESAFPADSTVTLWIGLALHDAGFLTEACGRFALAHARLADDEDAAYNHALCLARDGRWDEAADVLRLALTRSPGSASLRLLTGNVLRRRGRDADAHRAWSEFLDVSHPRDPRRRRVENALEEIGAAPSADPDEEAAPR